MPITDDNKLLTSSPLENVNIEMEDNSGSLQNSLESPPYSCLKNGSKPTYREWKKTQKNDDVLFNHKKRKVRLGKHDGKVSILISPKTRKNISREHLLLKQVKLNEMKKYLKKHNLLKSGSYAPSDVIKKMYEQSHLTGEINNSNVNNAVQNYLGE